MGSAFAADNFSGRLTQLLLEAGLAVSPSALQTISLIAITLILSYFTLVFGELMPKRIAVRNADKLALSMSGFVNVISHVFAPVVWLLTASTNGILRLFGINPNDEEELVTEEEIRMMVDAGSERGGIQPEEKEFIQNIFEFDDKSAEEVMTHRTEVALLWLEEDDEQWHRTIVEGRHSVYPVCAESADQIIGVLYVKDYFRLEDKNRESVMKLAVRPAYFVPETVRTDVLFRNMKKNRIHFAVVLDDYGGMSGIITMNNLLEQLVGELEDDITQPMDPPPVERLDESTWRIHGTAPLELVSQKLGVKLPEEEYDTFGGLIFGLLGSVPEDGSTPELEEFGLQVRVTQIREHRLDSAIVTLTGAKGR